MTSNQLCALPTEDIAKFPASELPELVQAAIALDRDIKESTKTLNKVKDRLIEAAGKEAAEAGMKQEGTTWTFKDPKGECARVSFPEKKLLSSFFLAKDLAYVKKGKGAKLVGDIMGLAGAGFGKLFAKHFKPAKAFRELLPTLIPEPGPRAQLLRLVEVPSNPTVSFGTAGPEEEEN